ncbi:MAG: hybrid sensor histidine kinase/response regulator [Betaproteobacteria bacterium]|nr:hybrid sensor histidine kinase/response regulator [Betaproteobacteria bacterium]
MIDRRLLALLIGLLCMLLQGQSARTSMVVSAGGVQLALPVVAGFRAPEGDERVVMSAVRVGVPPQHRMLALFLSKEDLKRFTEGEAPRLDRYYVVQIPKRAEGIAVTISDFQSVRHAMKNDHSLLMRGHSAGAAIRAKAIQRGLIRADRTLEERELARLILLPGFSTKDRVSEISGRGVGLDVVHDRVQSLKGTIEIRSTGSGQGATFETRIPASLVSVHALLVLASGQQYALPTHTIEQAFAPEAGEYVKIAGEMHFKYRERLYPMRKLAELGGIGRANDKQLELANYSVVLVRADEKTEAVLVESIVDGCDLITKDMGKFVRRVQGVAGVAILGDGVVAPLLDIPEMLRSPAAAQGHAQAGASAAPVEQVRVLVVDDSLDVRRSLMQLIGDSGLECQSANDGVEAVQAIEKFRPHVVITDLEMPNMNGLELTAHLRKRADTKDLPIIMITSRSQAKHREMAEKSGVSVYLTKPYGDADLMAQIGNLIEGRANEIKSAA